MQMVATRNRCNSLSGVIVKQVFWGYESPFFHGQTLCYSVPTICMKQTNVESFELIFVLLCWLLNDIASMCQGSCVKPVKWVLSWVGTELSYKNWNNNNKRNTTSCLSLWVRNINAMKLKKWHISYSFHTSWHPMSIACLYGRKA